jgi:hypothetical protein
MRPIRLLGTGAIALACVVPALTWITVRADEPAGKPPWQQALPAEDARKAEEQEQQIDQLEEAGKFAEALKLAELRAKSQGPTTGRR